VLCTQDVFSFVDGEAVRGVRRLIHGKAPFKLRVGGPRNAAPR
jgi:hypothetical protein